MSEAIDQGYVNVEVDDRMVATIEFGHPLSNSLTGAILRKLADTITERNPFRCKTDRSAFGRFESVLCRSQFRRIDFDQRPRYRKSVFLRICHGDQRLP